MTGIVFVDLTAALDKICERSLIKKDTNDYNII